MGKHKARHRIEGDENEKRGGKSPLGTHSLCTLIYTTVRTTMEYHLHMYVSTIHTFDIFASQFVMIRSSVPMLIFQSLERVQVFFL